MNSEPCLYFNSPSGCWFGDHCRYRHVKGETPRCRFYSGPGTCRNGSQCYFRHTDPDEGPKLKLEGEIKSEVDKDIASKEGEITSENKGQLTSENKGQVTSENKGQVTSENKDNKALKETIIKCGECGKLIHLKAVAKEINQGDPEGRDLDPLDGGESVGSMDSDITRSYNELEKHYYDKLLSMNKEHLSFLQRDPRFHKETMCNVCQRVFGKTRHLLQHITDKVKSGSDDEENHRELLHELVLAFTTRDLGMDDDRECVRALLLHLVASYTGDSDSGASCDSHPGRFGDFLRMLLLEERCTDWDDFEDVCNPWGFDEDDMFELACQGIKPWDPEAGMAMAVLSGAIEI